MILAWPSDLSRLMCTRPNCGPVLGRRISSLKIMPTTMSVFFLFGWRWVLQGHFPQHLHLQCKTASFNPNSSVHKETNRKPHLGNSSNICDAVEVHQPAGVVDTKQAGSDKREWHAVVCKLDEMLWPTEKEEARKQFSGSTMALPAAFHLDSGNGDAAEGARRRAKGRRGATKATR